jgi:hypothetical protein
MASSYREEIAGICSEILKLERRDYLDVRMTSGFEKGDMLRNLYATLGDYLNVLTCAALTPELVLSINNLNWGHVYIRGGPISAM